MTQPPVTPVLVISDMVMLADFAYKEYHTRVDALQRLAPPPSGEPSSDNQHDEDMEQ